MGFVAHEAITQDQNDQFFVNTKDDEATLFLIQKGFDDNILPKIATATTSKVVWNILEMTYSEIRSNPVQQSVPVVNETVIVTKEVRDSDIAKVMGKVVEEPTQTEEYIQYV